MKRLLFLSLMILIGCGNSAPNCDDNKIKEKLKEIFTVSFKKNARAKVMDDLYDDDWNDDLAAPGKEAIRDKIDEIDACVENFISGHTEDIPTNILNSINEYYKSYSLTNIRTNSIDEIAKSCSCSAQLEINNIKQDINYSAQKNSEGEIYVR